MKNFFKTKFSVVSHSEDVTDFAQEISKNIQKWLTGKYGAPIVSGIVSDWSLIYTGGTFGNQDQVGSFCIESENYTDPTDSNNKAWACRIIEFPKYKLNYIPRKWVTEIGCQSTAKGMAEVSYSVKYDDLSNYSGKTQFRPQFNVPNVVKSILSSDMWDCSINGDAVTIDTIHCAKSTGSLFGMDACRALIESKEELYGEGDTDSSLLCGESAYATEPGLGGLNEQPEMIDAEVNFTSLCYVTKDNDGRVWLYRLADIEDDKLQPPFKSEHADNYFENRDRLYQNDGPSAIGTVGIWNWTAIPNRNNPATDYVQSYYCKNYSPIRVVVLSAKSLDDVVEQLKNGTACTQPYLCDTFFCYEVKWGQLTGVLCRSEEFEISDRCAKLSEMIYSLPVYAVSTSDIYNWDDRNLRFFRELQLHGLSGHISVGNTDNIIRTLIIERITWPFFKESIGATKAEWRNSKLLLERICNESLYETVANKLKCTLPQAKQSVDSFIDHAEKLIELGDIDADVLAQIAMHHDELRKLCEDAVSQSWEKSHAAEIAAAKAEVADIKSAAECMERDSKQRLLDIEKSISSAEEKHSDILSEITTAQNRLDQLHIEISQYETLGESVLEAVRQKISGAQKDMAGFIADLSVILPQINSPAVLRNETASWKYSGAAAWTYSEEDIDLAESWEDELYTVSHNLVHSAKVENELSPMLAAFIYAAHINKVPVLIAGPGGHDIADALSAAIYACGAGGLTLCNDCDYNVADEVAKYDEPVISVRNMFGKGWSDILPQAFSSVEKHIIWTHPYVEDLAIEPKGLYNYMLPILSECFVGVGTSPETIPALGKRANDFEGFSHKKKQPLRIAAFKRLGLSKLLTQQLEIVLTDAKAIMDNPARDKDMEVLFGILPLCVLSGRVDILKDVIETESGVSNSVKDEVARYIKEE